MVTDTNGAAIPVLNTNTCCLTCVVVEVRSFQNVPFVDVGLNTIVPIQILLAVIHLPTLHHLQPLRVVPSKFLTLDFFSPFLIVFLFNKITQDFRMKYRERPVWFNNNLTSAKDPSFSAQWPKSSIKPTEYFQQKMVMILQTLCIILFLYTWHQYNIPFTVFSFTLFRKTSCSEQRSSTTMVSSLGGSRRANYCQF